MGGRFAALAAIVFTAYAYLLFHLYQIQVARSSYYFAKAQSQYSAASLVAAKRGTIYFTDKDGNLSEAAIERDVPVIYAVPKAIEDVHEAANQAALLLGKPVESLLKDLSKKASSYVLLDKKPDEATAKKVSEANVKGIYTETMPRRYYPFGSLASHVLGFVGPNSEDNGESGKYGTEKLYEKKLSAAPEKEKTSFAASVGGEDVILTVDPAVQREGERIIKNLVSAHRAKSAAFIVADPKTGKIVGMGATPGFDPNNYASSSVKNFQNPLVEQIYEPGSVFKVLTMVAAIDTGKITPDTLYNDTGKLVVNGKTIRNWDLKAHGTVSMTEVIEGSLNTGAAFAERKAGNDVFRSYIEKLGFGQKTGIDLPGELTGSIATIKAGAPEINYATASFGQGISATPLQVIQAIEAIANGGNLMRPYLNADSKPEVVRRVMSEDTSRRVTGMMVSAVDKAEVAKIDGYTVAGKTGTAQVPDFVHGGYTDNVVDTYVGFAPATSPRFIALIKLSEPEGAPHAAETVVPAFKQLAKYLLNYYNATPDRIGN